MERRLSAWVAVVGAIACMAGPGSGPARAEDILLQLQREITKTMQTGCPPFIGCQQSGASAPAPAPAPVQSDAERRRAQQIALDRQQALERQRAENAKADAAAQKRRAEAQARAAAERQGNMEVQAALNGLGFDAGAVDGDLGARSRAAIAGFQRQQGFPETGALAAAERTALLEGYRRAQAGETTPAGTELAGAGVTAALPEPAAPAPGPPSQPASPLPSQAASQPSVQPAMPQPAPALALGTDPGVLVPLPDLGAAPPASMASRCEIVEMATKVNQGPIRAADMTDPNQALSEQFCEARSYAVSVGQSASAGTSVDQLAGACRTIATAMAPVRAALTGEAPEAAAAAARAVNGRIGLQGRSSAATYGRICLGLAYRTDDAEMALAASLVLVGTGLEPYGELIGHHLREGFGVERSPAAARAWYRTALAALATGAAPEFLPSKAVERNAVIRAATGSDTRAEGAGDGTGGPTLVPAAAPMPAGAVLAR